MKTILLCTALLFGFVAAAGTGTGGSTATKGDVLDIAGTGTGGSTATKGDVLDIA